MIHLFLVGVWLLLAAYLFWWQWGQPDAGTAKYLPALAALLMAVYNLARWGVPRWLAHARRRPEEDRRGNG